MKKKWVIKRIPNNDYFTGAGLDGVYFGNEDIRYFDDEAEAERRLIYEAELFPSQFIIPSFEIIQVYTFN